MTAQNDKRTDKRISSLFSSVDRWTDEPDRQFLGTLRERSTAEFLTSSVGPNRKSQMATIQIWRIIMNNKITKLATASVIAVGVAGLPLSLLHNGASTAWAIEETIKTLENIKAMKLVGKMTQWAGGVADVTIWAAADANGEQSEYFRMDTSEQILVATPEMTYRYWPRVSKVRIEKGSSPNPVRPRNCYLTGPLTWCTISRPPLVVKAMCRNAFAGWAQHEAGLQSPQRLSL